MFDRERILEAFHWSGFTFQALTKFRNSLSKLFCRAEGRNHLCSHTTELKFQGRVPMKVANLKTLLSVISVGGVRATDFNRMRPGRLVRPHRKCGYGGNLKKQDPLINPAIFQTPAMFQTPALQELCLNLISCPFKASLFITHCSDTTAGTVQTDWLGEGRGRREENNVLSPTCCFLS